MAGFFDTLFGGGAEREAADKNRALTSQYGTDAQGYLKSSYDTGRGDLGQAIGSYAPLTELASKYNKGGDLYMDALGINGPEGNTRATGAFQTSPGYAAGIDAGMTGINRRRALGGMVDSGNADIDAMNYAQNSQNQQYNSWLQNLQATGNAGIGLTGTAAQGQAGGYTNLANLASQYGQNQTGVAGNVLGGNVNANNLQAAGEASGAKNLLGAGMSLASLAMGGMGGMAGGIPGAVGATSVGGAPLSGGGGFFGGLKSMFSSG